MRTHDRGTRRMAWCLGLVAALLAGPAPARAADVSGVYVSGAGTGADALHLKWADDEVVGRFVTQGRAYLLEGWLDEPGYMGLLVAADAPDEGVMYFVAAPVPEGMKLSLFAMDGSGEVDFARPLRAYELKRAPGRTPEIPAELLASLAGSDDAGEDGVGASSEDAVPGADASSAPGAPPASGSPAAAPSGAGPFHGPFHGDDGRGGIALLRLVQQGARLDGEITALGASARLAGSVNGSAIEGQVQASDATGTFKGTLAGATLDITFVLRGETGETVTLPMRLQRGEPKQMGERDPRLVGTWVKSSSYTSGDFSVATSQTCEIRADGMLTLYDGEMAGGGDAGSFSSGPSRGGVTSRWHTQGNLLYIDGQLYARFGFSGNTLGLWFSENGKPEIWSRR